MRIKSLQVEGNGRAKLNEMQVRVARRASELGLNVGAVLAAAWGVSKQAVSAGVTRQNWRHV